MIVIDPSKGGSDVGVVGNGIIEKNFNLLISEYIYDRLNELGADVKIIRDSDEYISDSERVNKIINSYGDNRKVVALVNTLGNVGKGVEIIYALRNKDTLAKSINDNLENSNIYVDKYYQKRNENDTSKDYYNIQDSTGNIETIIVDYGNVNNAEDANNLKNNYITYAEAVIKALSNYQGIPYYKEGDIDKTYIVEKGDSLYKISKKFGVTVDELKKVNNLKTNNLSIGQKLIIPNINVITDVETYIVQKGDSLYSIASKFNTTVENLKKLNNLSSNLLSIGDVLKVTNITNDNSYTVLKGDSLYSIANKYGISVDELKKNNNLASNTLQIGQILKIPTVSTSNPKDNIYIVQKGDSLYSIANKFNTTVNILKELNNLTNNNLSIGQILQLPQKENISSNVYIVQKGDSLYSIANKFNTTVEKIKNKNNLTSNLLSIGQQLII